MDDDTGSTSTHNRNGAGLVVVDQPPQEKEGGVAEAESNATSSLPAKAVLPPNTNTVNPSQSKLNDNNNRDDDQHQQQSSPQAPPPQKKRPICTRCKRPTPLACICEGLPASSIELKHCHVLVLQHPHETRRKNRSLPLMELCLAPTSMTVLQGRRLGESLDLLQKSSKVLLVFPPPPVLRDHTGTPLQPIPEPLNLREARAFCRGTDTENGTTNNNNNNNNNQVLVVLLDATWKYAKEMDKINTQLGLYPPQMQRVALSWDDRPPEALQPNRFDIRTPPSDTHLSTAECLAWVLSALEDEPPPNSSSLYERLMKPLDVMVRKWHECRVHHKDNHQDNHKLQRRKQQRKRRKPSQEETGPNNATKQDEENSKESESPPQQEQPKNYDYYSNPDHDPAVASQLTPEEALVSRTSFFTSGDRDQKLHNKKGRGRKRR